MALSIFSRRDAITEAHLALEPFLPLYRPKYQSPTRVSKFTSRELKPNSFSHLPPYQSPTRRFVSYLPPFLVPYAERMRLHKPVGYYAFYFPHLFGPLYAALVLYLL
ncbi:hypothetical protein BDR22DRAFT_856847 [Usnea florida]